MQSTKSQNIIATWLSWHFYEMPKFLFGVWKNYISFALDFFSLPILLKSLFAPWRRYNWIYPKGFDVGEFLSILISNIFSRILGALMRIVLIIIGILFQILVVVAGFIVLLLWVLIPFIVLAGFLFVLIK